MPPDINSLKHIEICKPQTYSTKTAMAGVRPILIYFNFTEEVMAMFRGVHDNDLNTSHLFNIFWEECASKTQRDMENKKGTKELGLEEAAQYIWQRSSAKFERMKERLKKGSFTFKEVDHLFSDFKGNIKPMFFRVLHTCN